MLPVLQKHNTPPLACPYPLGCLTQILYPQLELIRKLNHEGTFEELCHVRYHCQLMGSWSNVLVSIIGNIFPATEHHPRNNEGNGTLSGKWFVKEVAAFYSNDPDYG